MISLARYALLLKDPGIGKTYAVSVLGRLPIGITGLAILLLAQAFTGSFATGGVASGCYVLGLAAMAPAIGRVIDRYGPRWMLGATALLFPSALLALVLVAQTGAPIALVFLLAAAAGAMFPPITVCMRTHLKRRFKDEGLLSTAYSLESVLIELIFIVGPLVVAVFVALATPAAAVLFAAATGAAGTILFMRSPALRDWKIEPRKRRSLLGPLADSRFMWLIGIIFAYSTAFGLMEIGVTGYATERGSAASAGVFLGLMSAGSALGGLTYGSRSWGFKLTRQFAGALALMGIGLAALSLPWEPLAFGFWCIVAGIIMAPALIMQAMLVAKIAAPEHSTEAFTWSTSALLSGVGAGLAVGGALVETFDARAALAAAAGTAIASALVAYVTLKSN
ncbi:MAG TPA: MFS transporter [Burkholderiales bacterium]|nr:MFS transporter [Burkholderiales bacterium]